jgi:hypothetical protein
MKHPLRNLFLPSCTWGFLFSEEEKIDHGNRSELIKVILGTMEIRFIRRFLFRHAAATWQRSYVVFLVFLFYFIFPLHVKGYLLMVNTQISKCIE